MQSANEKNKNDNTNTTNLNYIYVIRCKDDTLYTGIAKDVTKRMGEHFYQKNGAKYTKSHIPEEILMVWSCVSWSEAAIMEHYFKTLSKSKKLALVNHPEDIASIEHNRMIGKNYTPCYTYNGPITELLKEKNVNE